MKPAVRRCPRGFRRGLGAWYLPLICLTAAAVGAPALAQDGAKLPGVLLSLAVPGGTAGLLSAAGLDPARPRTTALLDVIHVIHETPPGADGDVDERRTRVLSYLADLEARERAASRPQLPSDTVPLPLPESAWRSLTRTPAGSSSNLLRAILADRQASLLYFGLCSVDEETRRYLAARPALIEHLASPQRAPLAALFAQALRVRGDRIDPPGGPASTALWEAVAGEPVTQPETFIPAVLGKDGGRLALLYDAVGHMDPARQKFALGLWIDDPGLRLGRFRALYASCGRGLANWHPLLRPFARLLYDPAHLLLVTRVSPDGRPGALGWRLFWQRALGTPPRGARPDEETADVERGGPLDAAALLDVIHEARANFQRDVVEAWCFGERVFGQAPSASLPDVLVAVRGFQPYRTLVLTLERLGIDDPAVYAAAIGRADRIAAINDSDRAATTLSLYQGGLALIERARLARTIDAANAGRLVGLLARLPITPRGEDLGAVASWIESSFLPAIRASTTGNADAGAEALVLAAFAGRGPDGSATVRTVDYEGTRYRLDPSGVEQARMEAVREKQRGISLDAALAFSREVRTLAAARSRDEVRTRLPRVEGVAAPLLAQSRALPEWKGGTTLRAATSEVKSDLEAIRKAGDVRVATERVARLARAADYELGRVLVSLTYAAALPNPDSTTLMAGDPSLEHDWGLRAGGGLTRWHFAWGLPADSHDSAARWHVRGSLLALDLCLGTEGLHRLSADALPSPPTISEDDLRGFTEAALLANPFDYRDEDMARLSAAIWRGRLRVARLALDSSDLPNAAATAGLDETRRELVFWAAVNEPGRVPAFFSAADLLRLGGESEQHLPSLAAWGASGLSYDGRLSLRFPASQPFGTLAGRRTRGVMAALIPDLPLLVAESLDEHRLPAALTRSVLMVATLDYVDRLGLAYEDDWMTLVAGVQLIVLSRMDDYLASVTTAGPLVPVRRPNGGQRD